MTNTVATLLSAAFLFAAAAIEPAPAHAESTTSTIVVADSALGIIFADAKAAQPLKAGANLPAVTTLKNAKGENVDLAAATKGKTTILIFYRGSWCPYCNRHLAELATLQPELSAKGVQILAITPESVATLAAYPADKQRPYTILSDTDYAAARAFGVAFRMDAPTVTKYKGYGIDLSKLNATSDAVLPVPSVFVINPTGKITFAHANPDYKARLSSAEIRKAVGVVAP